MARIALALYWHQHQPYYPDDVTGEVLMPWVRLHGIKDYWGLAVLVKEFPELRCTFNYVPSLVTQLEDLAEGRVEDQHLRTSRVPASDLSHDDKVFMLENFFLAHHEHMIQPHPRYLALFRKRGVGSIPTGRAIRRYSEQEWRDLQVWANLTWFHPLLFTDGSLPAELEHKGMNFSEDEKSALLDRELEVLKEIVPLHKEMAASGQIEMTTSPFYHPILPILWDKRLAREAMPRVELPRHRESYPEDAVWHVRRAVAYHTQVFGEAPRGMWPSEGSVCQAIVPVLADAGIQWFASDEEILSMSTGGQVARDRQGHVRHPELLYRPYRVREGNNELHCVFRDHALSDLVGFHYQRFGADEAAADFVAKLKAIGQAVAPAEAFVPVILDGENAWEYYRNQGVDFLRALHRHLCADADVQTVRIGDYVSEHPDAEALPRLASGSWINHNFAIWIGHPEDNRAWDLLHETREHLRRRGPRPPETESADPLARAWKEIDIAEGSDWFWWFGDDHSSAQDALFDSLFRKHLKNVYELLGESAPAALHEIISRAAHWAKYTDPKAFLDLTINGRRTFFEWLCAGRYSCRSERGTMTLVTGGTLQEVYFGFDENHLLVRLDTHGPARQALQQVDAARIAFSQPAGAEIRLTSPARPDAMLSVSAGRRAVPSGGEAFAVDQIVEIRVPFKMLGAEPDDPLNFFIELLQEDSSTDRAPREGTINLTVPTADFEQIMWQV